MSQPFIGEIRMFAFGFAPKNWQPCNGQILAINQNAALFSILGTTYGGNGQTTFALPNLQGLAATHWGTSYVLGGVGGVQTVNLNSNQMGHLHTVGANSTANQSTASGHFPAAPPAPQNLYAPAPGNTVMIPTSTTGGSGAHNNMQPYLVVEYCIAIFGVFPTRN